MDPKRRRAADPDDHIGFLDEVEGPKAKPKRRSRDESERLDLDQVW